MARRKSNPTVVEQEAEAMADEFVDLTEDELAAQIEGYADIPASVRAEMALGRRASWEQQRRIEAADAPAEPDGEPLADMPEDGTDAPVQE
jgi:hypothetical protein